MKLEELFPPPPLVLKKKLFLGLSCLLFKKKKVHSLINLHGANKTQMCFVVPDNEKNAPE